MLDKDFQIKEDAKLYKRVFNTPDGKKVLDKLKRTCYIDSTTMGCASTVDTHLVTFREGMRNVMLHIDKYLNIDTKDKEE